MTYFIDCHFPNLFNFQKMFLLIIQKKCTGKNFVSTRIQVNLSMLTYQIHEDDFVYFEYVDILRVKNTTFK